MVLRNSALLVLGGAVVGILGAVLLARVLASGLSEVNPNDPAAYLAVAGTLLVVAAFSAWIPALRATRVDPVIALRAE